MRVVVASHPSSVEHYTGMYHPERPQRVGAVMRGIEDSGLEVTKIESPEATPEDLEIVHDRAYIDKVREMCAQGGGAFDMDTVVSPGSWTAALTAAGGLIETQRLVAQDGDGFGFGLTRPPGHHALVDRAMGFCIFNNVVIVARRLVAEGLRVAILDWDVHHGNGSQAQVADDPEILYISIHQSGFYPFEGSPADIDGGAPGTIVNIPLPAGTGGDVYRDAWDGIAIPVVEQFAPDWVLVSAGYDAHVSDPLADLRLVAADYGWMAARLAEAHPARRTVFALEGGYDLDALRDSAAATVLGMAGMAPAGSPLHSVPEASQDLKAARSVISRHWQV